MGHEKGVEIRWSDVDAYMHVNNALYATYLEECRDEWVDVTLGDAGDSTTRRSLSHARSSGSATRASRSASRSARVTVSWPPKPKRCWWLATASAAALVH